MEFEKRFKNKIKVSDDNDCWIWLGAKSKKGYGRFKINGKLYSPHRIILELEGIKIPNNLFVCHKCDNPSCVNSKHLFIGSRSDNMKDCFKKGRLVNNAKRKLNLNQIKEIRKLIKEGLTEREIAKRFSISYQTVNAIKHKKIWKNMLLSR